MPIDTLRAAEAPGSGKKENEKSQNPQHYHHDQHHYDQHHQHQRRRAAQRPAFKPPKAARSAAFTGPRSDRGYFYVS